MELNRYSFRKSYRSKVSTAVVQMQRDIADVMRSRPENRFCADCKVQLAESIWASTTLGAFLCIACAGVHRKIGVNVSRVKSVHMDSWTLEEVDMMKDGNLGVQQKYECSQTPDKILISADSDMDDREAWIRRKYIAREFSTSTRNDSHQKKVSKQSENADATLAAASRFADYFVTLGIGSLAPDQDLKKCTGPADLKLLSAVLDQYPENYHKAPLPAHISQFAFPEGYHLVSGNQHLDPTIFTFVLTDVSGVKMYASALTFYEELTPVEILGLFTPKENSEKEELEGGLPDWVLSIIDSSSKKNTSDSVIPNAAILAPKCLLVVSHYPFFSATRKFLQQMFRLSLSSSPIPIERYISNFITEIPLPPRGKIQVQFTLPDQAVTISRPPVNQLPLVDFAFRPLFQLLDIDNVLAVFSCLLLERKVALCSKKLAFLTPVAEALLSLLFPFTWQGAYIPILPDSLLDVVDAPVPFLVGIHASYLARSGNRRPEGVTFVDLDNNRIISALDETGSPIELPKMPERAAAKLKTKLQECAVFRPFSPEVSRVSLAFQVPEQCKPIENFASEGGIRTTIGSPPTSALSNNNSSNSVPSSHHHNLMTNRLKAKVRKNSFAASFRSTSVDTAFDSANAAATAAATAAASTTSSSNVEYSHPEMLVDSLQNETPDFSTFEIRHAFLRYFASILKKYGAYLKTEGDEDDGNGRFDTSGFLNSDHSVQASREFLSLMLETQMFQRFIEDRSSSSNIISSSPLPEVKFFDESIRAKMNRSVLKLGKKLVTEFLDDTSNDIKETFVTPAPSTLGLPDDGTLYQYHSRFPKLKPSLFGHVRKPRELCPQPIIRRQKSSTSVLQQVFTRAAQNTATNSSIGWEATQGSVIKIQAQYRRHLAQRAYHQVIWTRRNTAAYVIQSAMLRHYFLRLRAATLVLQHHVRGFLCRQSYKRLVSTACQIQVLVRAQRIRRQYVISKHGVISLQAIVRGKLTRNWWKSERINRISNLRHEIFKLWKDCRTSLWYRSEFWTTFDATTTSHYDFLSIGIHLQEVERLENCRKTQSIKVAPRMIVSSSTAKRFQSLVSRTPGGGQRRSSLSSHDLVSRKAKLARKSLLKNAKNTLDVATATLEEERLALYQIIKYCATVKGEEMHSFYADLGIGLAEKKKKRTLVRLLWEQYEQADASSKVVHDILTSYGSNVSSVAAVTENEEIENARAKRVQRNLASALRATLRVIR